MRRRLAAAVIAVAAMPAAAQQPAVSGSAAAETAFDFALPPPADTGQPPIRGPRAGDAPPPGRLELHGNLDRNGAVELRARAFSW
jgi:hypothetical protein